VLDKAWKALKSFHGWLNAIGSVVLAYALANPNAFTELKALLPQELQPWAPAAALAWFALVQLAKARAIKKAAERPQPAQ
jgi:hypothetical protein